VPSRRSPLIVVMQPTHVWDFPDPSNLRPLDRPRYRTIHVQRPVRAPVMIVSEVPGQEPPQISLVQDDHVVQACAADTPDEPFDRGVLPRTPGGDHDIFDPHVPYPLPKSGTVDAVTIASQMPWGLVPRERVDDLLGRPLRGRVCGHVDVHDMAPLMSQNQ
jgi:hypothetical protein